MQRKEILRLCVACREKKDQRDLIRVVAPPDEEGVSVDLQSKARGRGAYVCADRACIERALKRGAFRQHLKRAIPEGFEQELYAALEAKQIRSPRTIRLDSSIKPPELKQ